MGTHIVNLSLDDEAYEIWKTVSKEEHEAGVLGPY